MHIYRYSGTAMKFAGVDPSALDILDVLLPQRKDSFEQGTVN